MDPELEPMEPTPDLEEVQEQPPTPVTPGSVTATTGVVNGSVPSELAGWVIQVQRKVERMFVIPSGIYMDAAENIAEVSFWVDRNGNLLGNPTVTKPAADPALGEAGINAILLANPFPPLPESYAHAEQLIIYGFTLRQ